MSRGPWKRIHANKERNKPSATALSCDSRLLKAKKPVEITGPWRDMRHEGIQEVRITLIINIITIIILLLLFSSLGSRISFLSSASHLDLMCQASQGAR